MVVLGPSMQDWCQNQRSQDFSNSVDDTFKGVIYQKWKSWPLVFKPIFCTEAVGVHLWNFARLLVSFWMNSHRELGLSNPPEAEISCLGLCCLSACFTAVRRLIQNSSGKIVERELDFGLRKSKMNQNVRGVPEAHLKMNACPNFRQISTLNFVFCVFAFSVIKYGFWALWSNVQTPR